MADFTQIDAFAAGIALAFVVVVWAISPVKATRRDSTSRTPREVGAPTRGNHS